MNEELTEVAMGRVLVVAGSDSSGGAGIQADIKTITALGGFAATAITALTAQSTHGVKAVIGVPAGFVVEQMEAVLMDIGADVIKTGMLYDREIVRAVADCYERRAKGVKLVIDPVMLAKSGDSLLKPEARAALTERLIPLASVITPNVPEAEVITSLSIAGYEDMQRATEGLLALGAGAVLLKGGHLPGDSVVDLLRTADGEEFRFESSRQQTRHTHGTGCTLASALAAGLAEGLTLRDAAQKAHDFVQGAIKHAPGFGRGAGPLNHAYGVLARKSG